MTFVDSYFSKEDRYSVGVESTSGRHYLSIPVSSRVLGEDRGEALRFAEACRRRENDDLLIEKPGWNRGTPV